MSNNPHFLLVRHPTRVHRDSEVVPRSPPGLGEDGDSHRSVAPPFAGEDVGVQAAGLDVPRQGMAADKFSLIFFYPIVPPPVKGLWISQIKVITKLINEIVR